MAKDEKNTKAAATEESKVDGPETVRLFVRSVSPKGFRRIGRWFGPTEEAIDVTPDQARILFETDKAGDLRVLNQEMKDIAEGVSRRPAPRSAPKAEG